MFQIKNKIHNKNTYFKKLFKDIPNIIFCLLFIFLNSCNKPSDLSQNKDLEKKEQSKKDNISIDNIGNSDIKNVQSENRKSKKCPDYKLTLIDNSYTDELYDLVNDNKDHLKTFMPLTIDFYGTDKDKTYTYLSNSTIFGIEHKEKLIGLISLQDYKGFKNLDSIDLAYWLDKKYCKQGIMTDALSKIFDFLLLKNKADNINYKFEFNNIDQINICIEWNRTNEQKQNKISEKLAKKLGCSLFPLNKDGKYGYENWGYDPIKQEDSKLYYMTKESWKEKRKNLIK